MTDLRELARPFPEKYVHGNPSGGGSYVKHHVVVQRLLSITGPYDFELVEVIRGDVPEIPPNPNGNSKRAKEGSPALSNAIVGAVCRLRAPIDGRTVTVEDVGDCEQPHNWPHDGARLKDAMSDAIKRCAARFGLGLHLWSQDEYWLDGWFEKNEPDQTGEGGAEASSGKAGPGRDDVEPPSPAPSSERWDKLDATATDHGVSLNPTAVDEWCRSHFGADLAGLEDSQWATVRAKVRPKSGAGELAAESEKALAESKPAPAPAGME